MGCCWRGSAENEAEGLCLMLSSWRPWIVREDLMEERFAAKREDLRDGWTSVDGCVGCGV